MDVERGGLIACAWVIMNLMIPVASAQAESATGHGLGGYMYVSGYYDDNVFSYSDADKRSFESGGATAGKFPITSLSDFVTTVAARGDYNWRVRRHSMWKARASIDGTVYADNSDRDSYGVGLALDRVLRQAEVDLAVSYTPSYYLRHLYWRPMPERPVGVRYAAARYGRLTVRADARARLARRVDGLIQVGWANRNYEFPFNERDNNTYSWSGGVEVKMAHRVSAVAMGTFELSRARGADAVDPAVEDISNRRIGVEMTATFKMNRRLRFIESVDYDHQVYTTDNVTDAAHHDRRDDHIVATSSVRANLADGWQPEVSFSYRGSKSTTPPGVAEFGQYTGYRVGFQVTRYF